MEGLLSSYLGLVGVVLPLAACLLVGYFWQRFNRFEPAFVTFLVTRVSTPALVFHTLVTAPFEGSLLAQVAAMAVLSLVLCATFSLPVLRGLGARQPAHWMAAVFPNSGNFGLPVAYLSFGQEGFAVALIFFATCAIIQHSLGATAMRKQFSLRAVLVQPSLIAVALALLARAAPFTQVEPLMQTTRLLGGVTMPLMLLMLGNALARMPRAGLRGGVPVSVARLVLGPVAGCAAAWLLDVPAGIAAIGIVQMAMPVAVISHVYACAADPADADAVAGAVLISTLAALVLLPPLLQAVQAGL